MELNSLLKPLFAIIVLALLFSILFALSTIDARLDEIESSLALVKNGVDYSNREIYAIKQGTQGTVTGATPLPEEGPTSGLEVNVSGKEVRGKPGANLTLIEFSDFECPFCKQVHPVVLQLLEEYANDVNLVYLHLPFHEHSKELAAAFECAGMQGKRWEFADAIFAETDEFYDTAKQDYVPLEVVNTILKENAVALGLRSGDFNRCYDYKETLPIVLADAAQADGFRITGTPTFIIKGNKYVGALDYTQFKQVIDQELQAAK